MADATVVWIFSPRAQLRVVASNFTGRNYLTGGTLQTSNTAGQAQRDTTLTTAPSYVNLQAKLELKL